MSLHIDASDLDAWAARMEEAPPILQMEMGKRTVNLLQNGAAFMRQFAPRLTGRLQGSIRILSGGKFAGGVASGAYGTTLFYAPQRNFGGVIRARNAPFLVFQIGGQWIRTKQVFQTGAHFLEKSIEKLNPLIEREYRYALEAALGRLR